MKPPVLRLNFERCNECDLIIQSVHLCGYCRDCNGKLKRLLPSEYSAKERELTQIEFNKLNRFNEAVQSDGVIEEMNALIEKARSAE